MSSLTPSQVTAELHVIPLGAPPLELWFNGLFACLAACTCWTIAKREKSRTRKAIWLSVIIVMYTFATIHAVLTTTFEMVTVATHGGEPGIIAAELRPPPWYIGLGPAMEVMNFLIADSLFIWRCWVVWGRRWIIIIIPILTTISGTTLSILTIIGEVDIIKAGSVKPGTVPKLFLTFSAPFFGLSLATSLYATVFITAKIIMVQFDFESAAFRRRFALRYIKVVELIVESFILYSANLLAYVILTAQGNTRNAYPSAMLPQIAGIVPTLLLLRVANGQSRPDSTWTGAGTNTLGDITFRPPDSQPMRDNAHLASYSAYSREISTGPSTTFERTTEPYSSGSFTAKDSKLDLEAASKE